MVFIQYHSDIEELNVQFLHQPVRAAVGFPNESLCKGEADSPNGPPNVRRTLFGRFWNTKKSAGHKKSAKSTVSKVMSARAQRTTASWAEPGSRILAPSRAAAATPTWFLSSRQSRHPRLVFACRAHRCGAFRFPASPSRLITIITHVYVSYLL
jgi:hypothetical protein